MSYKTYWKDVFQSFKKSKGRFLSIMSLMGLGAFALIGLKVTAPNMEKTAQSYQNEAQTMDLAVMADYGLSQEDQTELQNIADSQVEFGYLVDVSIENSQKAVRIFSQPSDISLSQLVSGHFPSQTDEIVLGDNFQSDYTIGDRITFFESGSGHKVLKTQTFTITGFVKSAEIWSNINMGQSSAGAGTLNGYALVAEGAFDSDVYMIARLRYDDLKSLPYYDKDYEKKVVAHQARLDALLKDNGAQRLSALKGQSQEKLDDGYAEITDAEAKLEDGENQLQKAEDDLTTGQNQLTAGQAELAANQAKLAEAESQLRAGQAELAQREAQLAAAKEQLATAKSQLDQSKAQLDQAAKQIQGAQAELDASKAKLDEGQAQVTAGYASLIQGKEQLQVQKNQLLAQGIDPETVPEILAAEEKIRQQEEALSQAQSQLAVGEVAYEAGKAELEKQRSHYEQGLQQYQEGLTVYETNQTQYESGLAQLQTGQAQLQASEAEYQAGLSRLQEGQAELARNQDKLTDAQKQLEQSREDFSKESDSAKQEISSAKEDLLKGEKDLSQLKEPSYRTYSRKSLPGSEGYTVYLNSTNSIAAVSNIFPVVFYLVAAMVTFTTMTRFVDEERTNAGIFKALGYTNFQIISKFVIYGLVTGLIGTLIGILGGNYLLSPMISDLITADTVIGRANLYDYPAYILLAVGLSLLSAVLPAFLVARRELSEEAAQLLLPKPPVSGSSILLEKVSFIWKRLSFTQKVTARNIFRYKQRMLMTIFGVAGSVALLVGGLGIRSSLSGVASRQFDELLHYDMLVVDNNDASQTEKEDLLNYLSSDQVSHSQAIRHERIEKNIAGNQETISLLIADKDLDSFIKLTNRQTGQQLALPDDGLILTEKLAKLLKVSVGDSVSFTIKDKLVSGKVSGISEMYAGHSIYMSKAYYEELLGQNYQSNAYLLGLRDSSQTGIRTSASHLLSLAAVDAVVQNLSVINQVNTIVTSLEAIMIILVVVAVLLAIVILYNLTNINVAERIRELSTIKVLGFHSKEVTLYIYRETVLLSVLGIVTGLIAGHFLHQLLIELIAPHSMMFNPNATLEVYLIPIFAISIILTILGVLVNRRLKRVDMLEALKSVE